jgi:hypothetical protein
MTKKSDPTKDPEFQKVVRHFLTTPHQPLKPLGKKRPKTRDDAPSAGALGYFAT